MKDRGAWHHLPEDGWGLKLPEGQQGSGKAIYPFIPGDCNQILVLSIVKQYALLIPTKAYTIAEETEKVFRLGLRRVHFLIGLQNCFQASTLHHHKTSNLFTIFFGN